MLSMEGLFIVAFLQQWGSKPLDEFSLGMGMTFFGLLLVLFYQLRVRVFEDGLITISYGVGLIKINLSPKNVQLIEIVNTPWWYGLGIKVTPKGMLYNIQGLKAVRITYEKNGKPRRTTLGTNEPQPLYQALTSTLIKGDSP